MKERAPDRHDGWCQGIRPQEETRSMTHRNSPLTAVGRHRLVAQVVEVGRPIAHVAAEAHIARPRSRSGSNATARTAPSLEDRSSAPANRPSRLPIEVLELIEAWRRDEEVVRPPYRPRARRRARLPLLRENHVALAGPARDLNRIRDIDPTGENIRETGKIIARYPGHMVHMDVKKVGKIPDGGGWWAHGRGSAGPPGNAPTSRRSATPTCTPDRRVLPPGLHRGARERDSRNDHRLLPPRASVLRCSRHHPDLPSGHRQRRELHREPSFAP